MIELLKSKKIKKKPKNFADMGEPIERLNVAFY